MQRTVLLCVGLALSAPLSAGAQVAPLPDSVQVATLGPALVQLLDREIAAAAHGHGHVLKLDLPSSAAWSRVKAHLLSISNGRAPTAEDSVYTALSIRDERFVGDTVIVTLVKESLDRCPNNRWISTGTDYELRILHWRGRWTGSVSRLA